jgi:transposase
LQNVLWQLALALGGAAGVRLARHLHFSVSAETLLRRLKNTDCNPDHAVPISPPTVIGIDEWAFKRGHHYGTILVDVAQRQVLDLLPDRDATTVASWLSRYPTIRIVSRDRAGVYAQGIARGAPQAIQVADRWHLLKNLGEAVERVLTRLPA